MVQPEIQQQVARVGADVPFGKDARAHRLRQRRRGHLEGVGIDDGRLQAGQQVAPIGVGAHHHPVGGDRRAPGGRRYPFAAVAGQGDDGCIRMDRGAGIQRGARQPSRIAQRLHRAGTVIHPSAQIAVRAQQAAHLRTIQGASAL
ncbi:hypothetical protein G6F63_015347 [Rhizopus arrhizus]|nr:hypothetical protein G6F63_015347 [Rhizopus arrhizus]